MSCALQVKYSETVTRQTHQVPALQRQENHNVQQYAQFLKRRLYITGKVMYLTMYYKWKQRKKHWVDLLRLTANSSKHFTSSTVDSQKQISENHRFRKSEKYLLLPSAVSFKVSSYESLLSENELMWAPSSISCNPRAKAAARLFPISWTTLDAAWSTGREKLRKELSNLQIAQQKHKKFERLPYNKHLVTQIREDF